MKLLYLYSAYRGDKLERVARGELSDNQFYGLLRLRKYGINTAYVELEHYMPRAVASWLRHHILRVYLSHLPLFPAFFSNDVVFHVNSFSSQLLWILFGVTKPKWVLYDYSLTGFLGDLATWRQKLLSFIIRHSSGIVTISEEEKNRLELRFPMLRGKIEYIPYGTDTEYFRPRDVQEKNQILSVGLDPGRDYPTLFAALEGLPVRLLVTRSHRVKRFPRALPSNVEVRRLSEEELLDEYAASKIVVLPLNTAGGTNDSMGISTLVEAMAMGKAVIASKTFAMESYIRSGETGILVAQKSVPELRSAIRRLLEDDELRARLGAQARAYAVEQCDAEHVARRMAVFFNRYKPTPKHL
ncbi:MAG TPA: glycosyltransferase family 4 protein [Candidatus Paceibacterota bacterium]|nr:glycosyltransferase family 4 protein [Candidatus Paceibacterota bacterium]